MLVDALVDRIRTHSEWPQPVTYHAGGAPPMSIRVTGPEACPALSVQLRSGDGAWQVLALDDKALARVYAALLQWCKRCHPGEYARAHDVRALLWSVGDA